LLLAYKPVQHVTVLNTVGNYNTVLSIIIIIIIGVQPLGWFGQEPEPSQATGMALVRCILGKFLGVVCHYNIIILRDHRRICGPSLTETSLCGPYLYAQWSRVAVSC